MNSSHVTDPSPLQSIWKKVSSSIATAYPEMMWKKRVIKKKIKKNKIKRERERERERERVRGREKVI